MKLELFLSKLLYLKYFMYLYFSTSIKQVTYSKHKLHIQTFSKQNNTNVQKTTSHKRWDSAKRFFKSPT